jgi:hypothetical protein
VHAPGDSSNTSWLQCTNSICSTLQAATEVFDGFDCVLAPTL